MPTLQLSDEERVELRDVLTSYLSDLRMEIADTDSYDFRQGLKKREAVLNDLLRRLQ
jgi:hypothetical protein